MCVLWIKERVLGWNGQHFVHCVLLLICTACKSCLLLFQITRFFANVFISDSMPVSKNIFANKILIEIFGIKIPKYLLRCYFSFIISTTYMSGNKILNDILGSKLPQHLPRYVYYFNFTFSAKLCLETRS